MPEIVLPPLTPKEIGARDHQENLLNIGLNKCWRGDDFDGERGDKLTRAYAIEVFNTLCPFYRAKIGYRAEWLPQIVHEAVIRVLVVYQGHVELGITEVGNRLSDTIIDDLRNNSTSEYARSEFNAAFPATRNIPDMPSGASPLSQMAIAEARGEHTKLSTPQEIVPTFGEELSRLMLEARVKPEQIADQLGINWRTIYRHLSGKYSPTLTTLGKYEQVLSTRLGRVVKLPTPVKRQSASKMPVKRQ